VGSFTRDFERLMKGSVEVERLSLREFWSEGYFTGTPKNILSKVFEVSVCCHRATAFRDMKGRSIPRAFKERQNFFI